MIHTPHGRHTRLQHREVELELKRELCAPLRAACPAASRATKGSARRGGRADRGAGRGARRGAEAPRWPSSSTTGSSSRDLQPVVRPDHRATTSERSAPGRRCCAQEVARLADPIHAGFENHHEGQISYPDPANRYSLGSRILSSRQTWQRLLRPPEDRLGGGGAARRAGGALAVPVLPRRRAT